MADKPEAKEPAEAPPAELKGPESGLPGGAMAWIPAVAAILIAPVASFAVAQFVLVPKFQKKLSATVVTAEAAAPAAAAESSSAPSSGKEGGGEAKGAGSNSYDFANVVVNLSGTMGTRYLKTSFTVTGPEKDMKGTFEANKPRLTDVTLNVLSALSLSELEEPGSKNVLRGKLVTAYNQALGHHAVDQVYFSDFLIQ